MTSFKRNLTHSVIAAAVAALTGFGMSGAAMAQGAVKSNHGDWQIRCDNATGPGVENCALMQSVTAKDNSNIGVLVMLLKSKNKKPVLRVLAPLGVLLPGGLGLKIDKTVLGKTPFLFCRPNGCISESSVESKVLNLLKAGSKATFVIFQSPKKAIGLPVSLKGFTAGFDALTPVGTEAKAIMIKPKTPKPAAMAPIAKTPEPATEVKKMAAPAPAPAPAKPAQGNVSTTVKTLPLATPGPTKNETRMSPSKKK